MNWRRAEEELRLFRDGDRARRGNPAKGDAQRWLRTHESGQAGKNHGCQGRDCHAPHGTFRRGAHFGVRQAVAVAVIKRHLVGRTPGKDGHGQQQTEDRESPGDPQTGLPASIRGYWQQVQAHGYSQYRPLVNALSGGGHINKPDKEDGRQKIK